MRVKHEEQAEGQEALSTEIERLKAENTSLLESLRAAREQREKAFATAEDYEAQARAAEQRAEAAEKRNAELQGALRAARAWFAEEAEDGRGDAWKMRDLCRAALHDEERSAPRCTHYDRSDWQVPCPACASHPPPANSRAKPRAAATEALDSISESRTAAQGEEK